jgi:hypothetical protein
MAVAAIFFIYRDRKIGFGIADLEEEPKKQRVEWVQYKPFPVRVSVAFSMTCA